MSNIHIYRSGVRYLGTCNRKGAHKENFNSLWDPEWCTLESKVSFIASLRFTCGSTFWGTKSREVFPPDLLPTQKTDFQKVSASLKERSLHSNLQSLNLCKLRKSILTTIYSLNLCFECRDFFWAGALQRRRRFKNTNSLHAVKQQELKEKKEESEDKSEKK